MPVPSTVADLSATIALNSPAGGDVIGSNLDDYLRAHAGIIRQVSDAKANAGANSDITSLSGMTGNINFSGTGNRITGDFSNATLANRAIAQSSITNSNTTWTVMPNGTATASGFQAVNNSDIANSGRGYLLCGPAEFGIYTDKVGTGTFLPMTFYTGGSEGMRIDTNRNIYGTSGTTAMTNGFFYIPAAAGAPSGVPTAVSGRVPMYYDTTNNKFYIYNGVWKQVVLA